MMSTVLFLLARMTHLESCPGAGRRLLRRRCSGALFRPQEACEQAGFQISLAERLTKGKRRTGWSKRGHGSGQQARQRGTYQLLQQVGGSGRMVATAGAEAGGTKARVRRGPSPALQGSHICRSRRRRALSGLPPCRAARGAELIQAAIASTGSCRSWSRGVQLSAGTHGCPRGIAGSRRGRPCKRTRLGLQKHLNVTEPSTVSWRSTESRAVLTA